MTYQKTWSRLLIIVLLFPSAIIHAQSNGDFGSWNTIGIKWKVNKKFSLQLDNHIRSTEFYHNFYHIDVKLNAQYKLFDWIAFLAGTGRYYVYTKGGDFIDPITQTETRLWEEVFFEKAVSRFIFEDRNRLEQRFIGDIYKNRLRVRLGLTIPLNHPTLRPKTIFAYTYDDMFIVKELEINRIFGGLGYRTDFGSFQAGWLHQTRYILDRKEYSNMLSVTMIFEIKGKNI